MNISNSLKMMFCSCALLVGACGSGSSNAPKQESDTVENQEGDTLAGQERSVLEGEWILNCYEDTEAPAEYGDIFRQVLVTFSGGKTGTFSSVFSSHYYHTCTDPELPGYSGALMGTYSIGAESKRGEWTWEGDIDLMTSSDTSVASQMVSPVLDSPLDLTIFYIQGDTLHFGDNNALDLEPLERSTSILFKRPFIKQ